MIICHATFLVDVVKAFLTPTCLTSINRYCGEKQTEVEKAKDQFHNVISYECFLCGLDGIGAGNIKNHIEEYHEDVTDNVVGCKSCKVDVEDVPDHIVSKHASVRRMKKSYVKVCFDQNQQFDSTLVLAVKTKVNKEGNYEIDQNQPSDSTLVVAVKTKVNK